MNRNIFIILITLIFVLPLYASAFTLEGTVGKYPIVVELEKIGDGKYSGRYAYKSTLKRDGNVKCSWLTIQPSTDNPYRKWIVRDCKQNVVETWYDINVYGQSRLTANMTNKAGKSYHITVSAQDPSVDMSSLKSYYQSHIGKMVFEFDMFNNSKVKNRLIKLMGQEGYIALKEIYQVQEDMCYDKGMFWGSGFMAHQCCDPATVWAYDSHTNNFYVWIRKDDHDYWWSESGDIPISFQALVDSAFGLEGW